MSEVQYNNTFATHSVQTDRLLADTSKIVYILRLLRSLRAALEYLVEAHAAKDLYPVDHDRVGDRYAVYGVCKEL